MLSLRRVTAWVDSLASGTTVSPDALQRLGRLACGSGLDGLEKDMPPCLLLQAVIADRCGRVQGFFKVAAFQNMT